MPQQFWLNLEPFNGRLALAFVSSRTMQSSPQSAYIVSSPDEVNGPECSDGECSDGIASAATEPQCEPPLAGTAGERIKHRFVHLNTHEKWIGVDRSYTMDIDVNQNLQVRVNGGPSHGSAKYGHDDRADAWELTFHYKADESKMKKVRFHQVPQTQAYLHVAPAGQASYNAMLSLKVD